MCNKTGIQSTDISFNDSFWHHHGKHLIVDIKFTVDLGIIIEGTFQ